MNSIEFIENECLEEYLSNQEDEKVFEELEEPFINYPLSKNRALTKKCYEIDQIISLPRSKESLEKVNSLKKEVQEIFKNLKKAIRTEFKKENILPSELKGFQSWNHKICETMNDFDQRLEYWMVGSYNSNIADHEFEDKQFINEDENMTSISQVSSKLSTASKINVKQASIEAREIFQKQKTELEMERIEREFQRQKEDILYQDKLQMLQISQDKMAADILNESANSIRDFEKPPRIQNRNLSDSKERQLSTLNVVNQNSNEIALMLLKSQERAFLPRNEPEVFDGKDPTKYKSFVMFFERSIERHCHDAADKFQFQEEYKSGRPKELVKSCNQVDIENGYPEARKLLHEQYNNEENITSSDLLKLETPIKGKTHKAFKSLSIYLTSCSNKMEKMSSLSHLNSSIEIRNIVRLLPHHMRLALKDKASKLIRWDELVLKEIAFDWKSRLRKFYPRNYLP